MTALTMHTLSNNGLYYSTSCVPKRSMNWVKHEGNGHFPTLSSFLRVHGYIFVEVSMHACINKKIAKIFAVRVRVHDITGMRPMDVW